MMIIIIIKYNNNDKIMKIVKIANRIIINNQSHYNNSNKVTMYTQKIVPNIGHNDLAHIWLIEIQNCILCMHALNYSSNFFLKKCVFYSAVPS